MLPNMIVANLHNIVTGKYHPIMYRVAPFPGDEPSTFRYKSLGHHTSGFDNREDALKECENNKNTIIEKLGATAELCVEKDFIWEDENIPASVSFFYEKDGKIFPA